MLSEDHEEDWEDASSVDVSSITVEAAMNSSQS